MVSVLDNRVFQTNKMNNKHKTDSILIICVLKCTKAHAAFGRGEGLGWGGEFAIPSDGFLSPG